MRRPLTVAEALAAVSLAGCLSMALTMTGCARPYRPIPDGEYSTPPGDDHVSVHDGHILLHVLPWNGGRHPRDSDTTYQYTVLPDSRIVICTMTSAEAVNGIGGFDWLWDGERIVQKDSRRPGSRDKIYARVPPS